MEMKKEKLENEIDLDFKEDMLRKKKKVDEIIRKDREKLLQSLMSNNK
jgi:hypothetical protein